MPAPISADVVNAFLGPVLHVLKACVGAEGRLGKMDLANVLPPPPTLSVRIEVKGRLVGAVMWSFDPEVARELASRMLSTDTPPALDSPECADVVSELANIIAGNATGALLDAGYQVELSPPQMTFQDAETNGTLPEHVPNITVNTPYGQMNLLIGVHQADG